MIDLERDLRQMYERREADLHDPRFAPPDAPEALLRRTHRRQVGVVLTATVAAAIVAIAVTTGAIALLRSSERRVPATPDETPAPVDVTVRPYGLENFDRRYPIAAVSGEAEGTQWTIWTNEDLSCLAFATSRASDGGCGYDGSDLTTPSSCWWSCPVANRPILFGPVSARVARVELVVDDGTTYPGTIHPTPPGVTVDSRVYTVPTLEVAFGFTGTLTAFGADGEVLEQVRYPPDADEPGGRSMPVGVEATFAAGVPVSEVDGRTSEPDRWELAVWRTRSGDWCLGTIYPESSTPVAGPGVSIAVVGTETAGCGAREDLFDGIRTGAIGHADVWSIDVREMFGEGGGRYAYRAWGTVSEDVAAVRLEVEDGQVVEAELLDPPPGFEDMGRVFVAEFDSKLHPWESGGEGGITWRAIALDANGEVLGSDEISR